MLRIFDKLKKIILLVAAVLALVAGCHAEKILSVKMEVYKSDAVDLKELRVEDNYLSKTPAEGGEYKLQILDRSMKVLFETPLAINYVLFSDPPVLTNSSFVYVRAPYSVDMNRIILYRNSKRIFEKDIALCNDNRICETDYESNLTCPDCRLNVGENSSVIAYKRWAINPKKIWNASSLGATDERTGDAQIPEAASRQNYFPYFLLATAAVFLAYWLFKRKKRD